MEYETLEKEILDTSGFTDEEGELFVWILEEYEISESYSNFKTKTWDKMVQTIGSELYKIYKDLLDRKEIETKK